MLQKKNRRMLFAALLGLLVVLGVFARGIATKDFMSLREAQKRWGHEKFDSQRFRTGDAKTKASMAVAMIEGNTFIGKPISEVKPVLGEFTGHYWNDDIPTYIIEEGWKTGKDTWQLVFLPDGERKVRQIKIHKNCCN